MPLSQVGYLVVTIPSGLRDNFYSVKALKDFKEYWKRKIKREITTADNNTRGLIRYHWAGEDGSTWKPHLNILINKGHISPQLLERWRHDLKFWFKNYFKLEKAPAPNLFYRYTPKDGEKYHKIKYITRATMLNFPDIKTKDFFLKDLKNFKNTTLFGKFPKCKPLEKDEQKIYLHNKCAITGEPITWKYYIKDITKVISKQYLEDKGLGIFYAETIYTSFKENEALSNLGKVHKPQKIITYGHFDPGEILKTWFPDKYIFAVDQFLYTGIIFYKKIKPLLICNKIAL